MTTMTMTVAPERPDTEPDNLGLAPPSPSETIAPPVKEPPIDPDPVDPKPEHPPFPPREPEPDPVPDRPPMPEPPTEPYPRRVNR